MELPIRLALAAQLTGIPESSLREKIQRGEIRAKRDGAKLILVRLKDINDWFESLNDAQSHVQKKVESQAPAERRRNSVRAPKRQDPLHGSVERPTRLRLSKADL
jgi:excisionase family DNA binding protein